MNKLKRSLGAGQATVSEILGRNPSGRAPLSRRVLKNGIVLVGNETGRNYEGVFTAAEIGPMKKRKRRQ